jgi:hypothetical protein
MSEFLEDVYNLTSNQAMIAIAILVYGALFATGLHWFEKEQGPTQSPRLSITSAMTAHALVRRSFIFDRAYVSSFLVRPPEPRGVPEPRGHKLIHHVHRYNLDRRGTARFFS